MESGDLWKDSGGPSFHRKNPGGGEPGTRTWSRTSSMKISVNKEDVCAMLEGSPHFGASGPPWRTEVSSPMEGLGWVGCRGRKRRKGEGSKKGPLSFGCWCGLRTGERPTWIWSQFEVFLSHMTEISWRRLLVLSLSLPVSFLPSFSSCSCTYIFVLLMMLLKEGVESSGNSGEGEKYPTHYVS